MHDDVEAVGQGFYQALRRILGADIQGHGASTQARRQRLQRIGCLWHIEQHHLGAITGEHFGDGGTDAARGPCDQRFLAGQRARPVPDLFTAGAEPQHLAGNVSALRREEEAQRAFQLLLATLADIEQLHAPAATNFLAQRAGKTFQRALYAGGDWVFERLGGTAQHYHARAVGQALESRLEEITQFDQLFETGQVASVEHQCLELGPVLGGPAGQVELAVARGEQLIRELAGKRLDCLDQVAFTAEQQGAVDRSYAAGHPAFQAHRRRQTEGANQAAAGG